MSKTTLEWSQEVERRLEPMVALRRDFHRHPELSLQEHRTAQIIAERLHAAGLDADDPVVLLQQLAVAHGGQGADKADLLRPCQQHGDG